MRLIFMGTPEFAVPCLEKLIESHHEILMVITQPDRPKGRGKKLAAPPVKAKAMLHQLPLLQSERIRDPEIIEQIHKLKPDCIVVVAFGQILPKDLLKIPSLGCINVHASLLPRFRGAAPINWAIINGEEVTGVTTMYMDEGLDTGDMILKREIVVGDMTAGELYEKLGIMGAELLDTTLELVEKGDAPREKQEDLLSSYAPIMDKNLGKIDWTKPAKEICNLIRGLNPWPSAFSTYKGEKFKIWKGSFVNQDCNGVPGQIIRVDKSGILVCTGNKMLNIEIVQFPNSKSMTVDEYIRGHLIEEECILGE